MSCSEDSSILGLEGSFNGYGNRSRNGRWPPWPMSQSWLGAGLRMNLQLLILSPVLFFQCHTASEPILGTLFCARFLSLPQSHSWSLQDMGTNRSFPARVPSSLFSSSLHSYPCLALPTWKGSSQPEGPVSVSALNQFSSLTFSTGVDKTVIQREGYSAGPATVSLSTQGSVPIMLSHWGL